MKTTILTFILFAFLFVGCKKEEPGTNEVFIEMNSFSPSSLTISAGTTVVWTNKDAVTHTVTSDNGTFDSGDMGKNTTFSNTFSTVGTFRYHCRIHSGMKGTIIVE